MRATFWAHGRGSRRCLESFDRSSVPIARTATILAVCLFGLLNLRAELAAGVPSSDAGQGQRIAGEIEHFALAHGASMGYSGDRGRRARDLGGSFAGQRLSDRVLRCADGLVSVLHQPDQHMVRAAVAHSYVPDYRQSPWHPTYGWRSAGPALGPHS